MKQPTWERDDFPRERQTAFDWHGGGGSPLYRFASNRRIDDGEHGRDLLAEIDEDIAWCKSHPKTEEAADMPNLVALRECVSDLLST
jgi:hypothetical protein